MKLFCVHKFNNNLNHTGVDLKGHPNIQAWIARCRENLPGIEENEEGAQIFGGFVKGKLAEIAKK